MSSQQEIIKIYNNVFEAEAAKAILDSCGIDAYVSKDDCGGMRPELQFSQGVKLIVNSEQIEKAKEILDAEPISAANVVPTDFMTEAEEHEFEELKKEYAEKKSQSMSIWRNIFLFAGIFFLILSLQTFNESDIKIRYCLQILALIFMAFYVWTLLSKRKNNERT